MHSNNLYDVGEKSIHGIDKRQGDIIISEVTAAYCQVGSSDQESPQTISRCTRIYRREVKERHNIRKTRGHPEQGQGEQPPY